MNPTSLPSDWNDDLKMTVMFSPFRDKNLNPKSWEQKIKFWTELIIADCIESKRAVVTVSILKEQFRRKGKRPACLETVLAEMKRRGQVQSASSYQNASSGWLSWSYSKLVKDPLAWSLKMLSRHEEKKSEENLIVVGVIKIKAAQLIEMRKHMDLVDIEEYCVLREQHTTLCDTDMEFDIVMQELCNLKQVVIHESENKTKLVKFLKNEGKQVQRPGDIVEQDLHIHRIQKAHGLLKRQIECLSLEVQSLAKEAVSYKQQGMTKLAMSVMRKRRLCQQRVDQLTGSMNTLEDILYRIKQAESNEMILRAIEGGTKVLRDVTGKNTADEVTSILDSLADMTEEQDAISADLSFQVGGDEQTQAELEDELASILQEGGSPQPSCASDISQDNRDLEKELSEILKDSSLTERREKSGKMSELDDLLNDLQLPDVPKTSPSRPLAPEKKLTLTS